MRKRALNASFLNSPNAGEDEVEEDIEQQTTAVEGHQPLIEGTAEWALLNIEEDNAFNIEEFS